jgi:hypothetical protein
VIKLIYDGWGYGARARGNKCLQPSFEEGRGELEELERKRPGKRLRVDGRIILKCLKI